MKTNVTIVGGGNVGMCLLGDISRNKTYSVTLCTSRPSEFIVPIDIFDAEKDLLYRSGTYRVTDDTLDAVSRADIILCTLPAFLREEFVHKVEDVLKEGSSLWFIPAYGGAELFCGKLINRGVSICGLQKVPYVARTIRYGVEAGMLSRKKELFVGSIPNKFSEKYSATLKDMLGIKSTPLPNFLSATLLPGNPLLHTSGSYLYLKDYVPGKTYDHQIMYYEEWTDEFSKLLFKMSDEMIEMCSALPIDMSYVKGISEYYESKSPEDFTLKAHSIPSFKELKLPMKVLGDETYIPDFDSRYFKEDFPFGLAIIKGLSKITGTKTEAIDSVLDWYSKISGETYFNEDGSLGPSYSSTAIPQRFCINTKEKLISFYTR